MVKLTEKYIDTDLYSLSILNDKFIDIEPELCSDYTFETCVNLTHFTDKYIQFKFLQSFSKKLTFRLSIEIKDIEFHYEIEKRFDQLLRLKRKLEEDKEEEEENTNTPSKENQVEATNSEKEEEEKYEKKESRKEKFQRIKKNLQFNK